jgi:plastocyanin
MEVRMTLFQSTIIAVLALAFTAPAAAQPAAQTIQLYSFGFTPRAIHLAAGRPVTLNFVNSAGGGHNFSAPSFFATAKIASGSAPNGVVELGAHQSRAITLTPRAGTYKFRCTHTFHKALGMTGTILVD